MLLFFFYLFCFFSTSETTSDLFLWTDHMRNYWLLERAVGLYHIFLFIFSSSCHFHHSLSPLLLLLHLPFTFQFFFFFAIKIYCFVLQKIAIEQKKRKTKRWEEEKLLFLKLNFSLKNKQFYSTFFLWQFTKKMVMVI